MVDAVAPVFAIVSIGFLAGRVLRLDARTLARTGFYTLSPALTFSSLYSSTTGFETAWRLCLSTFLLPFALIGVSLGLFRLLKLHQDMLRAMLVPAVFANAAFYGLPICLFAFGTEGMSNGVVFVVCQNVLLASLAVYIAASSKLSFADAARRVLKVPTLYAACAAAIARIMRLELPPFALRPISLLAQAAPPMFLLTLGLSLASTETEGALREPLAVVFIRLIVAPLTAFAIGKMVGLSGLPLKILVLQEAMPPAVNATVLAQEFGSYPAIISRATMLAIVASLVTLPAWIYVLERL